MKLSRNNLVLQDIYSNACNEVGRTFVVVTHSKEVAEHVARTSHFKGGLL